MNIIKQEILSNSLKKASNLFFFLPFSVLSFVDWGNFFGIFLTMATSDTILSIGFGILVYFV